MPVGHPITWDDITPEIHADTTRALVFEQRATDEQARDAVTSAAIKLISRRAIPRSVEGLLLITARHELLDARRRRERYRRMVDDQYLGSDPQASIESIAVAPESADPVTQIAESESEVHSLGALHRALKRISPGMREILTTHYLEETPLTAMEASGMLAPGTAKHRVANARKSLRRALLGPGSKAGRSLE